jgi:uncharacterized protein
MSLNSPFHEGELEAQRLAGETAQGESNGAMIGDKIMAGALNFIRAQRMAIVSSRDARGRRWASMLFGKPGFLEPSSDRKSMRIAVDVKENDEADPLWENLRTEARTGLLIIELASRRRLRVNGAANLENNTLTISVEESFANCPKYITRREVQIQPLPEAVSGKRVRRGNTLGKAQSSLLASTDVLFLATGHPQRGADASHRGGNPGFLEVVHENKLRIPDYSGNSMFNTLGNLLVDAHYGILVPDFRAGRMLQLTGTAKVTWDGRDEPQHTGGINRFVEYQIDEWREQSMPADVSENLLDYSPYNPR